MAHFPAELPSPTQSGFSYSADMGLVRWDRYPWQQRRRSAQRGLTYRLSFVLTHAQYLIFERFYHTEGRHWFQILLPQPLTEVFEPAEPDVVYLARFTGDYTMNLDGSDSFTVSVNAEMRQATNAHKGINLAKGSYALTGAALSITFS